MDLIILEQCLREQVHEDTLVLHDDARLEQKLLGLFTALNVTVFPIEQYSMERTEQWLEVRGRAVLSNMAEGYKSRVTLRFKIDQNGQLEYHLNAVYQENAPFEKWFGPTFSGYLQRNAFLQKTESPLNAINLSDLELSLYSWRVLSDYPFTFTCRLSVAASEFWDLFPQWARAAVWARGRLSLCPVQNGNLRVRLEIPLAGAQLPAAVLGSWFDDSSITLSADSAYPSPLPAAEWDERITVLWVNVRLNLPGCAKPVEVTADLLSGAEQWNFGADFPRRLTVTDLGQTVLTLLGLEDRVVLSVPQGLGLDAFGLFSLQFSFWGNPLHLGRLEIVAGTTRALSLPLACLSLDQVYIRWYAMWSDLQRSNMYYNILIQGRLRLTLPGGMLLVLRGKAALPQMEFEASLETFSTPVKGADLLGDAARNLPFESGVLKDLTLYYAHQRRELRISADLKDLVQFTLGKVQISLEDVMIYAMLSEKETAFSLNGTFCLLGGTANAFYISLEASYGDGDWLFHGWLSGGRLNITALLAGFLGISWESSQGAFTLTHLDLSYQTESGLFQLTAAFNESWKLGFGNVTVQEGGRLLLRTQGDATQASVLLSLKVGIFEAAVQADNFFDKTACRYLFQLKIGQQALRAVYEKVQREEELHEIISVELRNTTLGSLVALLVGMVNPNRSCQLPAPWNLLDKIDLSRFRLEMDLTDETVLFTYRLDLSIPGLVHLTQVGLLYQDERLYFVICGKTAGKEEETYQWDALDGAPPDLAQQEATSFHLWYLGLGYHYSTPELEAAVSIQEGLTAMEQSFPSSAQEAADLFDGNSGWTLGADLEVDRMLHLQLLFHDPTLYGAVLEVSAEEPPLNFFKGLSLTLLYRKLESGVGLFQTTFILPEWLRHFAFGPFGVTFGTISLSVYTNGDFLLDLGFPYNGDFSRSFTLLLGKYQIQGGFYFGVLSQASSEVLPQTTTGRFSKALALGIGISVEFGERYDFGLVKGGLTLTVTGLFEGYFAFFYANTGHTSFFYQTEAMVGFTGRLFLSVDLKIISISASLTISARARAFLRACMPIELELALALEMRASIRILFFRINFSFHFSTTFRCSLGSRTPAPWEAARYLKQARSLGTPFLPQRNGEAAPLALVVTPIFSRTEETLGPCVAFVPMVEKTEFLRFCEALADWLVTALPEDILDSDAQQMTDAWVDETFSYGAICGFFRQEMPLSLSIASLEPENLEQEACAFPMPPEVALSFGAEGEAENPIRYWEENLVDGAYANRIAQYFAALDPDPTHSIQTNRSADGERTPLAQLVFVDYIHMLLRDLAGAIKNAFEGLTLTVEQLVQAQKLCGTAPSDLLAENPSLTLREGRLSLSGVPYILPVGATLQTLAQSCGCTVAELAACCGNQLHLLHQGAAFVLAGRFDNTLLKKNTLFCAAYCFVRRHEFAVETGYPSVAQELAKENPNLPGGLGWEETEGGTALSLGGEEWAALPGDTLERLAKTLVLVSAQPGRYPQWDAFLDQVCRINQVSRGDVPDTLTLPEESLQVDGDATLSALLRRLSPQAPEEALDGLQDAAIFEPLRQAALNLNCGLTEGQTLAALLADTQAPVEAVMQALAEQPDCFQPGQTIAVRQPQWIHRSLLKILLGQRSAESGAMASRFLLQGLRLPRPDTNDSGSVPYYQLLGQQFAFDETTDRVVCLTPREGGSWVQGSPRRNYPAAQMMKQLPEAAFRWTHYIQSGGFAAGFDPVARYYTPTSTLRLVDAKGHATKVVHLLSAAARADLPAMTQGIEALADGQTAEAQPCLLLPFQVRQVEGRTADELWVDGVNSEQRDLLAALAFAGQDVQLQLCAAASPTQTEGVLSALDLDGQKTVLVRANLSLETHRTPVTLLRSGRRDTVTLEEIGFARMLWECSVVGGGYRLHLSSPLGQDSLDEGGAGTLWLLAVSGKENPLSLLGAANALQTPVTGQGGLFGNGSVAFTARNGVELGLYDLRPVFPAGCYGAELCLSPIGEEETEENKARSLYSIMEYQISGPNYTVPAGDSLPLMPEADEAGNVYRPVLPLSRLADPRDRYGMLGKEASVQFFCRDLLGNRAPGSWESPSLSPYYNDALVGVHQWPGCTLGYKIEGSCGAPMLSLTIAGQVMTGQDEERATAAAMLELSLAQLARPEVRWEVEASVTGTVIVINNDLRAAVLKWGTDLLEALRKGESQQPEPLQMEWKLEKLSIPADKPLRLWVKLRFVRTQYCSPQATEYPELSWSEGEVSPWIQAEESSCETFAKALEQAMPQVKLARPGEEGTEFYLVSVGEGGLIQSLTVSPQRNYPDGTMAPVYWAIRPLANHYLEREVTVVALKEDGTLEEQGAACTLTQVDLDAWADDFLTDVEQLITRYGGQGGVLAAPSMEELLQTKERLAACIAEQLLPVETDAEATDSQPKEILKDRLRRTLCLSGQLASIASYTMQLKTACPIRLTIDLQTQSQEEKVWSVQPGKLDSEKESFCVLYQSASRARNGFSPKLSFFIRELEYDLEKKEWGYEKSRWLVFVRPITAEDSFVCVNLDSGLSVPNPLRRCPGTPVLTEHKAVLAGAAPLDRWSYSLHCKAELYEQDRFRFETRFGSSLARVRSKKTGLLEALAQYRAVRDGLMQALEGKDNKVFRNALATYSLLAARAAAAWAAEDSPRLQSNGKEVCIVDAVPDFALEKVFRVQTDWPNVSVAFSEGTEPALGEPSEFVLTVPDLSVYQYQKAESSVTVYRNSDLLRSRDGTSIETNAAFWFQSETVEIPSITVSAQYTRPLPELKISGGLSRDALEQGMKVLENCLGLQSASMPVKVTVAVSYRYQVPELDEKALVVLPVTFLPPALYDPKIFTAQLTETLWSWYQLRTPASREPAFAFAITVFRENGEVLLSCNELWLTFGAET